MPKRIDSKTCSFKCSKRAEKLRAKAKAYNAGTKNIRADTIEALLPVLEADVKWGVRIEIKPGYVRVPGKSGSKYMKVA